MTAVTKLNNYRLRDFTILESKTWTIPQFRFAVFSFCLQIVTGFFVIPKCFLDSPAGVLQFLDGQDIPIVSLHAPKHFLRYFASIVWLDTGGLVASRVLMEAASWPNEAIMCRMLLQELRSAFHDQWQYEKFRAYFSQNRVMFSEVSQRLVP